MEKSPEQIAIIQKEELELLKLPGFFSEVELQTIEDWCDRSRSDSGGTSTRLEALASKGNDWTSHPQGELKDEIDHFFRKKIEPLINPDQRLRLAFDFAFHGNQKPYGIHTDSGYDADEFIFQQGIIPLNVTPADSKVYTVILRQKCYHSSAFPNLGASPELQTHVYGISFDDPEMKKDFPQFWQDTDFRRQQMNGFSLAYPFLWKRGDSVIWHRSHVHCSSDFEVSGTSFKRGLMWISRILR